MKNEQNNTSKNTQVEDNGFHLEELARQYGVVLSRYFGRRGCDQADVDDLVQNVFTRLAGRRATTHIENPEAYLMTTASSVWKDYLRKRITHGYKDHVEYDDEQHSPECFGPDRVLEGREAVKRLAAALMELPPRTRQVYVLCRVDGMKRKDVARRIGISVSAIEKHLMKATTHISVLFGDYR
ncbi:MAG: RNA polymerase subunit sigma-24 [Alphaproteobacteria bacterium]|nr:MAG: RNA polymerase subunit sigma-24 [Alphaproteobacteria bacterium]